MKTKISLYQKVETSFSPIYDSFTSILILGSHPSIRSKEIGFYYMHKTNRFWQVLSVIYKIDFTKLTKEEKINKLNMLHIGLYDVIYSCEIVGSQDSKIKNPLPTDLHTIINNSFIKRIFLNGKTSYRLFIKFFPEYINIATYLPSTSAANAQYSLDKLIEAWNEILNI